jgi:hypothetical protein
VTSWLRRRWPVAALSALAVLALLVIANWQLVALAIFALSQEQRPALLSGAEWNKPSPAFSHQFPPGAPEANLRKWLADNRFEIRGQGAASKLVGGVPCAEAIDVVWQARAGWLTRASATVREAGCL